MYNKPNELNVHKKMYINTMSSMDTKIYNKPDDFNVNKRCIINQMSSMYTNNVYK